MKKIILLLIIAVLWIGIKTPTVEASTTQRAGIVVTSGSTLNVRKSASTSSTRISSVAHNTYLTVLSTNGSFYYVEYSEEKYGYVHSDYVKIVSSNAKKVSTNGSNLNVRYGPSTSYYAFEKIKDLDTVVVLSTSGSFSNVLFEGNKVGYVSSAYLTSSSTYKQISLKVTSYKQYDSRWASTYIGNSGKTMKQIGCLTTDMAMLESYRRGTSITPLTIAQTFSYTSSGDMYWPSNYEFSTASNYLSTAYQMLAKGKPVLIGLKNNSGGQHWVVITGHVGSNSLSSANFTINDPGSSSRTRLNEVLYSYPNFYKIAYYK